MINLNLSNQSLDIKFIWFGQGTLSKLDESTQEGKNIPLNTKLMTISEFPQPFLNKSSSNKIFYFSGGFSGGSTPSSWFERQHRHQQVQNEPVHPEEAGPRKDPQLESHHNRKHSRIASVS
jgi:hypothetical protein